MSIDRLANLRNQEQNVKDYIAKVNSQYTSPESMPSLQGTMGTPTRDMLASVGEKYGMTNISSSGSESTQAAQDRINRDRQSFSSEKRLETKRKQVNQLYSYALDKYINSGMDLQTAQEYARQFALDESDRQFQAGQMADERNLITQKKGISDFYNTGNIQPDYQNQYEQALLRSVMGLGGSLGSAAILNMKSTPKTYPGKASYNPNINYSDINPRQTSLLNK